jgi:hypothetical protein
MKIKNTLIAAGTVVMSSFLTLAGGSLQAATASSLINFETLPGSSPSDNLAISNQFASQGVTFGIDNNGDGIADSNLFPQLEKIGQNDSINGFVNGGKGNDVAEVGYEDRLGNYFLRTAGLGGNGGSLFISYDDPTKAASGEIWDIDGNNNGGRTEQWEVQLLGQNNTLLDTITSPLGTNANNDQNGGELDGKPWLFSFERDTADVYGIRFEFKGNSDPSKVGLAFDNFSARSVEGKSQSVPEPGSVIGLGVLAGLGLLRRRQLKQS